MRLGVTNHWNEATPLFQLFPKFVKSFLGGVSRRVSSHPRFNGEETPHYVRGDTPPSNPERSEGSPIQSKGETDPLRTFLKRDLKFFGWSWRRGLFPPPMINEGFAPFLTFPQRHKVFFGRSSRRVSLPPRFKEETPRKGSSG